MAERALAALTQRPAGLITDVDGTISRITAPASAATVEPAARRALAQLVGLLDMTAVVSGRDARDARRMLGLDGMLYLGNHGLEQLQGGTLTVSPAAEPFRPNVAAALAELRRTLDLPGVSFEDKGVTASVHFRESPDPFVAERAVVEAAERVALAHGLRVTRGRMVVELRPPVALNKGTAVRDLARSRGLRGVVFIGDDRTDVDAMEAVAALRASDGVAGLSVGVLGPDTPAAVRERADVTVDDVDGVVDLLERLVVGLRRLRSAPHR